MTEQIHSCSYFCDKPACIKAQRDELRDRLDKQPPYPLSTAQRLRELAVSQQTHRAHELESIIAKAHLCDGESWSECSDDHLSAFLLIVACSLDGGEV